MQPLKEVAQKWHDLGLKIVPVELGLDAENKKTVRCLWKWKRDPYPGFTCLDWRGANGFGITLGRTSHGYIVCVDCDHDAGQDAYSSFVKAFPDLTKTYIERTPNGFHLFVYIDKPLDASNINIKTKNGTELHVNGLIFMAPTKYHGREYEIYNASEIIKISDFYQQYQKAFDTPKKQVDIAYVLNGVPEGERNEAAIQLASWYRRRKKLDEQETKKKLSDWNTKNNPPLLREELQNIIENAYRNTTP